ncbi:hypothetical protein Si099_01818 [Streptococcus infantarius subsp. infantarius]|nr:hypothetical protein [Streptococcus infantarius subsp. infantarius]
MLPVGEIDFDYEFAYLDEENGYRCERDFDEFKLMQFTGLKDKNGKEIFDGDIIKFTLTNGFNYVVDEDGSVTYKLGAFYVVNGLAEYLISDINTNEIEVIGNIYETPELLKGE